jgi:hypothetical protein
MNKRGARFGQDETKGAPMVADGNIGYNIESGNLPTAGQPDYLTGKVNGLLAFLAPLTNVLYSAEIRGFQFHLPVYYDDQIGQGVSRIQICT